MIKDRFSIRLKTKRIILFSLFFSLAACSDNIDNQADVATEVVVQGSAEERKPNIVLIMADDMGWGDAGYHGGEINTPSIDSLAAEGIRLNRMYAYPACTQTRAALLSGQRMRTMGLVEPLPPWTEAGLPLDVDTLAELLQAENYATWKVGKWHLGHHYVEQFPNQRGYDHFYGFLSGEVNYFTHVFQSALDWQRNGEVAIEEGYVTDLLTDEAVRLLNEHPTDKPFFLDLSYSAPHTPLQAPEEAMAEYAHIEDYNRQRYAAMLTEMDLGIAKVIDAIKQRPDADRTLVIFLSDNGGSNDFGASNYPLKGVKTSQYEGGIRVPAIAWWPGTLDTGIRDQIISVHDLYPTLLSLAGSDTEHSPEITGVNIWPSIVDDSSVNRTEPIVLALMIPGRPGTPATYGVSIIDGDFKLIEMYSYRMMAPSNSEKYQLTSRELYNIVDDPLEQVDLVSSNPEKVDELSALLEAVPMGEPIGFMPPPSDWTLAITPGAEPNDSPPTREPLLEAARERSLNQ